MRWRDVPKEEQNNVTEFLAHIESACNSSSVMREALFERRQITDSAWSAAMARLQEPDLDELRERCRKMWPDLRCSFIEISNNEWMVELVGSDEASEMEAYGPTPKAALLALLGE